MPRAGSSAFLALVLAPLALVAALIPACSGGSSQQGGGDSCTSDIASIQRQVFVGACATQGCHAAASPAGGLDLASPGVASRLVGVSSATCDGKTLVVPGHPEMSFLFDKLSADKPACGAHMPPTGALPAEDLTCIEQWITSLPPSDVDGGVDAPSCETCGGAACVDLQTDAEHCGACDTACPQGATCASGVCTCNGGLADCNGSCVDTSSDAANCGTCGDACGAGKVCSAGSCAASCGALTDCSGSCVDTTTSLTNCGACGNVCPGGTTCTNGACVCPGGGTSCNGKCIDTQTDAANCGACGNACAPGQTCAAGKCTCGNASVSFANDVQPIFTASCASAGCHKGVNPQEGLDLGAGKAYASLVDVTAKQCNDGRKRVLPGQPSQSYLIDKMTGVDLCFGSIMPKGGGLPSAETTAVANWICAGAPNN